MKKLGALIFDCDGTLIDSAPVYAQAWAEGFASSGAIIEPVRFKTWYMANNGLSESVLIDTFSSKCGAGVDREAVIARMRAAFLARLHEIHENPAVAKIAKGFTGRLPMAVASGGPRQIVEACLSATGLRHLFAHVVTHDDVPVAKPAPAIFLEAARRLGVQPEQCVAFEDSKVGIAAARTANMKVVDVSASSYFSL